MQTPLTLLFVRIQNKITKVFTSIPHCYYPILISTAFSFYVFWLVSGYFFFFRENNTDFLYLLPYFWSFV